MHPEIERLDQLFLQGKNNPAVFHAFFDTLWLANDSLPRSEMRRVVDEILGWTGAQVPLQANNQAIATLASGWAAFHEGNFEASLLILAEARRLFGEIKDEDGMLATMVAEGINYRTLGEIEPALKHLLYAHQHLSKTGRYKTFRSFCMYMLGEIYSDTRQYDEALRFHQFCEKYTGPGETENKNMLSRALNGIGIVYQHQKKYALALEYLTRSLQLAVEVNNLPNQARALTDLGSYYFEMGAWESATRYQLDALNIRREMNIQNGAVTNMMVLAEISVKSGRQDDAIEWLNKALPITEQLKVKQKMFQIHCMLSEIYQAKGDLVLSLFHYKAYHSIREEVQHEDNEKKIKNLQLVFEAEQTIKENAIIKAQKAEIESKNHQLQGTIDELTITRVSRKAKALTLVVGITLIVAQDPIFYIVLSRIGQNNYLLSLAAKAIIILSLKPINIAIENYLLRRIILKKKKTSFAAHPG